MYLNIIHLKVTYLKIVFIKMAYLKIGHLKKAYLKMVYLTKDLTDNVNKGYYSFAMQWKWIHVSYTNYFHTVNNFHGLG